jgi:tRNA threonylcarbamoyladenosine biosynthesis protein TsaE
VSPILRPNALEFFSNSAAQTRRVGMRLGEMLRTGDLICLTGDLGSGKTTLTQGIAAGWGSPDQVSSPTFVLVNVYRKPNGTRLYHLDAYRLGGPAEADDLDLDTLLATGPLVIEWADRIEPALPDEHLMIACQWVDDHRREMVFTAQGPRYQEILDTFRQRVYAV